MNLKFSPQKTKNFFLKTFFFLSLSKLLRFGVSVILDRSVVLFLFGYIHPTAENGICIGEALKVPKGPSNGPPIARRELKENRRERERVRRLLFYKRIVLIDLLAVMSSLDESKRRNRRRECLCIYSKTGPIHTLLQPGHTTIYFLAKEKRIYLFFFRLGQSVKT